MNTVILSSVIGAVGILASTILGIAFSQIFAQFKQVFAQFNQVFAQIDALGNKIDKTRYDLTAEITAVRKDLTAEITAVRKDLTTEITAVRGEVHAQGERLAHIEGRLVPTTDTGTTEPTLTVS